MEPSPPGIDVTTPNVARIYDYFLGGKEHFAADRAAAEQILRAVPDARQAARANRDFLARAVRTLAEAGIGQFLDIGAGLPTQGSVHEIARESVPGARVVYADIDPVVLAHSRAIVGGEPDIGVVQGDLRAPEKILDATGDLIDFTRPVGVLLLAVLHFVPDEEDPYGIMARLVAGLAPGSHVVVSHGYDDGLAPSDYDAAQQVYRRSTSAIHSRDHARVAALLPGCEILEPGVVALPDWRPLIARDAPSPRSTHFLAAVGRVQKSEEPTG